MGYFLMGSMGCSLYNIAAPLGLHQSAGSVKGRVDAFPMLPELQITPAASIGCAASVLEAKFTKVHVCICIYNPARPRPF